MLKLLPVSQYWVFIDDSRKHRNEICVFGIISIKGIFRSGTFGRRNRELERNSVPGSGRIVEQEISGKLHLLSSVCTTYRILKTMSLNWSRNSLPI